MTSAKRFLLLSHHAASRALLGRRGLGLVLLTALPVGLAWLQVRYDENVDLENFAATMLMFVFQFALPFAGLFLGVAALGDEIDGRTLTYLFTRPMARPAIFLARFSGLSAAFLLLLVPLIFLASLVFSSRVPIAPAEAAATAGIAALGFLAYAAIFATLRVLVRRALFLGFILGFVVEGFVSKLPGAGVARWSVWHHLALLETRIFAPAALRRGELEELLRGIEDTETVSGSLTVLLAVLLVSLAAGVWLVRVRETRLANTNA